MVLTSGSAHCWCELHNSIAVWIYGTLAELLKYKVNSAGPMAGSTANGKVSSMAG